MAKNKDKKSMERMLLEDVSPKFQEKQAVLDACASDKNVMKEYITNGLLSDALDGYSQELSKAREKYETLTGKNFPAEKEEKYFNSFMEVTNKLNKFYGF